MENDFSEIKESLLPILKDLIGEYSIIKPASNNVMTREKVLGMIKDLCGIVYGKTNEVTFGSVMKDIAYAEKIEDYNISKRMASYEIVHGVFYKFMFKSIENNGIKVIFYVNNSCKTEQFKNIINEKKFRDIFNDKIKQIKNSKEDLEIIFNNDSRIRFLYASDGARGNRYHYAVVDMTISKDIFNNIIRPQSMFYDIDKERMGLTDIYNIEFIEM